MRLNVDFLTTVDPEEISDVLVKIERSFNIRFKDDAFKDVVSFGDMCDVIYENIKHTHAEGCTTQQAFYKFRNAFMAVSPCGKSDITPACKVKTIFPEDNRIALIEQVESELGFKLNILQPKAWVSATLVIVLLASIVACFVYGLIGSVGILIAAAGLKLSTRFCSELNVKTVGDLVAKIARENYAKSRRHSNTVNRNEIEQKVRELFADQLATQPELLKREMIFG